MKKLLLILGIAVCTIFSTFGFISSKGSLDNFVFLQNIEVKNAVVETNTSEYTLILDNSISNFEELGATLIFDGNGSNSRIDFIKSDLSLYSLTGDFLVSFVSVLQQGSNIFMDFLGNTTMLMKVDHQRIEEDITIEPNTWYGFEYDTENNLVSLTEVIAVKFINYSLPTDKSIQDINNILTPYIGNLTSLPSEEPTPPTPEPDPDSIESSIGNVIRGIIDWFVDIFNGLADAFVIIDSSGQFVGFTIWGQVLFIEVGIGLVILVFKWVISLIRGV